MVMNFEQNGIDLDEVDSKNKQNGSFSSPDMSNSIDTFSEKRKLSPESIFFIENEKQRIRLSKQNSYNTDASENFYNYLFKSTDDTKHTNVDIISKSTTPNLTNEITIGEYIWARLVQVGVHTVFGLPGDFNTHLLEKISQVDDIQWCGNTSELNASYAADGYSRMKGIGVICTTFGVGELSSLNGIAGSFAEHVGVLHIVGSPALSTQQEKLLVHHTLGNGDFKVFQRMSAELSHYNVMIQDTDMATFEIDKCIVNCILSQKPCYLSIPVTMVNALVPSSTLDVPLILSAPQTEPDLEKELNIVDSIINSLNSSKQPIIVVDGCCYRHNIMKETNELIKLTNFPVFVTPMGKGAIDEQLPTFGGIYIGTMSSPEVKEYVDNSDLVICIGSILNDFATSTFHFYFKSKNLIEFSINYIRVKSAKYPELKMKSVLNKLINRLNHLDKKGCFKYGKNANPGIKKELSIPVPITSQAFLNNDEPLRQSWIWEEISKWLRPGDTVIAETGTSSFGVMQTKFPGKCVGISQVLWGASGYSLGSALGVLTAQEDIQNRSEKIIHKRCIVFVGDGSFQFTVQEVSTMLKHNYKPYIFVMNNNGYTLERIVHHSTAKEPTYNNVQPWNLNMILNMFGGRVKGSTDDDDDFNSENFKVSTVGQFKSMLSDDEFSTPDRLRLIEVVLPMMDAPSNLLNHLKKYQSVQ
ncbi:hypothetical protein FOG51_01436 [Hanseniaspora uvarum]|nr:hypothetical protein FOG51_01436 [Hanseniaspora uvarum]